jgi:hypothetical protein
MLAKGSTSLSALVEKRYAKINVIIRAGGMTKGCIT